MKSWEPVPNNPRTRNMHFRVGGTEAPLPLLWSHRTWQTCGLGPAKGPQVHSHTSEHSSGWLNQEPNLGAPSTASQIPSCLPHGGTGSLPPTLALLTQAVQPLLTILGCDIKVSYDEAASLLHICGQDQASGLH